MDGTASAPARIRRRPLPVLDAAGWPGMPPLLQRLYAARGVRSAEAAAVPLKRLLAPDALGGLGPALDLLVAARADGRRIVVVGDFDCDGATGTAVAVRGLRMLGFPDVHYQVPHRMLHGYGLSPALVDAMAPLAPRLLLTVDSGINCLAGVAAARARGWQVLVTDHHLAGAVLPEADAIVNPNVQGDAFPSKAIAGVGVVFYLLLALRRRLREDGLLGDAEPDLAALLDLVAVGTVADLVALDENNRVLVAAGLKRLRAGRAAPGLLALAAVAGRDVAALTTSDIGFAIAPRLNAAGRLEDMALGIECLLSDDPAAAHAMAERLHRINAERRDLQQQMVDEADARVAEWPTPAGGALPAALCLHDPGWHPGIIGLVASRLKERLHRPVLAFAPADEGGEVLRGSARSIPGFHVRDALALVDARHPGLVARFGGHAMAAGLTLDAARFEEFRLAFEAVAHAALDAAALQQEWLTDGPLEPAEYARDTAEALRGAGPWGQGFPEPLFDEVFDVLEWRPVGTRHLKLTLRAPGAAAPVGAIHFGGWTGTPPPPRLHAVFQLELDDYQGRRGVQLLLRHWQPA